MTRYLYFLIFLILLNYCYSIELCSEIEEEECPKNFVVTGEKIFQCIWGQKDDNSGNECKSGSEISSCSEAANLKDITNEQCLALASGGGYCFKGTSGCIVPSNCADIIVSVEEQVCNGFTKLDDEYKCEKDGSNGCKLNKAQCLDTTSYTYDDDICSKLGTSEGYICYSDGEKCVQANSCGTVGETKYEETGDNSAKLTAICNLFDNCIPAGNKCKTDTASEEEEETEDECNSINNIDECSIISKEKKLILCKWVSESEVGKQCQYDKEITSCKDAASLNKLTNDQCLILTPSSEKYCLKGDDGCIEPTSCADIKVEVSETVCNEFTNLEDEYKCVKNGVNGCTITKALCTDTTLYTYNGDICKNLQPSDGYICYSDGEKCVQANSCGTVGETKYEETGDNSAKLTAICNLFDNCIPAGNKCKTDTASEEEEEEEEPTETVCSGYTTEEKCNIIVKDDKKLVKCIWKEPSEGQAKKCLVDGIQYETCASAKELAGVTDEQCKDLTLSTGKYCIGGPNGCIEVTYCDDVVVNVDENVCERIEPRLTYKTCTKKEEGKGCEAIGKSCTTEFTDYSSVNCDELTPSVGYTCYNTGERCKEANSCLGVEATTLSGDGLTAFCKKFGDKCVPDGNKCKIESICSGKGENDCKLTLDSNILFDCEWDAESTQSCKEGAVYETCESAKALAKATNEQCSALTVEDNQKCVKGDNGCEVVDEKEDDDGKAKGNSSAWLFTATIMNFVLILAF